MALSFTLASATAQSSAANPISVDIWTFIFQSLNVLIVLGGLYVLLFRPISTMMAKRERFVEESLTKAASTRTEAERLLAEYQAQMRNARQEAQQLVDKMAKEAQEYERRRRAEADAEYEKLIEKAKTDIEIERQRVMAAMRDEVATLTVMATEKVLGKVIDENSHRDLVEQFVQEVGDIQ